MDNGNELLPMVDAEGNVIGSVKRSVCHDGCSKTLHPVVHLHLIDDHGRVLLQKRSANKKIQPGKWDTGVGGHVDFGETIFDALVREAFEEIGFLIADPGVVSHVSSYIFESSIERELINCYVAKCDSSFLPKISEPDDIDELCFWPSDRLSDAREDIFTPNFISEFKTVIYPYLSNGIK